MEYFDLYFAWPNDQSPIRTAAPGMRCRLDGCDGFFDQYFDACPDQIRFAVLFPDSSGALVPSEQAVFEALPFIEARVIARGAADGEVEVTRKLSLGEWMRTVSLPTGHSPVNLPFDEQSERELCMTLLQKSEARNWMLGTASRSSQSRLSAVCIFTVGTERRCLALRDNCAPSIIFRISE